MLSSRKFEEGSLNPKWESSAVTNTKPPEGKRGFTSHPAGCSGCKLAGASFCAICFAPGYISGLDLGRQLEKSHSHRDP